MQMPSPLLLPTAVEVPMANQGEVPLLCPPERLRERAEAQRAKRRKTLPLSEQHPPSEASPTRASAVEGKARLPPPLSKDTSFNRFELDHELGSPLWQAARSA